MGQVRTGPGHREGVSLLHALHASAHGVTDVDACTVWCYPLAVSLM